MKNNEEQQIIELIQGGQPDSSSSMVRTQKQEVSLHTIFLDEDIGEPKKYRDLIHQLFQANSNDVFIFIINSAGGYLSSAGAIIEAIKSTEAEVRAVLLGECHSAASIIALHCHTVIVTESANMLVHTLQNGYAGNAHAVQKHADFSTKLAYKLLDSTYAGFLTEKELSDVKMGVELWLDDREISKRLKMRMKYQEEQMEKPKVRQKSTAKKKPNSEVIE